MVTYQVPGLYREEVFPSPAPGLLTGVPVFLGYAARGPVNAPQRLTLWPQFGAQFGPPLTTGYLAAAVRGFFENDGLLCHVLRLDDAVAPLDGLRGGLAAARALDEADLVCAPDIMRSATPSETPDVDAVIRMQAEVLAHCRRAGDRFAILDGVLTSDIAGIKQQRAALAGVDGALYHPWLWAPGGDGLPLHTPPCGHVAGAYSRSDQEVGVHKAPANEVLEGALDLRVNLSERTVGDLHTKGVNCLRALPGGGIRVWGARTLSEDPVWRHVNARRVFLTVSRWLERFMAAVVHEPNDIRLWVRIMRELSAYFEQLFSRGALKGGTPDEAFFVKCDSETNPPEVIAAGRVVTQIGLALTAPAEFIVARIIHGASGVAVHASAPAA